MNFKLSFIVFFFFFLGVTNTFSQESKTSWFLEQNIRYQDSILVPTTTMGGNVKVNDKFTHGFFALTTTHWAQLKYGITYSLTPWMTTGLSVGFEQNIEHITPRISPMLLLKGKNISWLTVAEFGVGEGNYWWTSHLLYTHKHISFGLMSRRFYGSGVQLKYKFNKHMHIGVWGAGLYDHEAEVFKPTVSLRIGF